MTGVQTCALPIFRTAGFAPQFQVLLNGGSTGIVAQVTAASFGPGAIPNSSNTLDVRTLGSTDSIMQVRSESQGQVRLKALGGSAVAKLETTNASELALGTNTTDRIRISSTGGLHFAGGTPVAQQTLPTGASKTVDDVITALQNLGLVKQS